MELNDIGKIAQSHGLKGEVKIKTDSDFIDERFKEGATVYIGEKDNYKPLIVKSHRSMKGYELVSFEGYDDIDSLYPILGKTLYAEKDRDLLDEDEYFYSDYIGLKVSQFGKILGEVKDIESFPQYDYLVVENEEGKEKLIPLLDEFISDVDLENEILYIVDMEGLL